MREDAFYEDLPVQLTDEELIAIGRKVGRLGQEIEDLEDEAKRNADSFKQRIKALRHQARYAERCLRTSTEDRQVRCTEQLDPKTKMVAVVRTDTGEEVRSRPAREDELQMQMGYEEPAKPKRKGSRKKKNETPEQAAPEPGPTESLEEGQEGEEEDDPREVVERYSGEKPGEDGFYGG